MTDKQQGSDKKIKVHVYVLCWNEEVILPHFLKHYAFADKIVVYDNGSDDGSLKLLEAAANVEIRNFTTDEEISNDRYLEIKNSVWKESRGQADFVIVCDTDEFLYHPDLPAVLDEMKRREATILMPKGYEMVGEKTPEPDDDLISQMREGMRLHTYDKCLLFDPDAIEESNYEMGCHVCRPVGKIQYCRVPGLVMLHYKHLSPDFVWDRYELYKQRMSKKDVDRGHAPHYQITRERLEERYEMMRGKKIDVIARAEELADGGQWKNQPENLREMFLAAMGPFAKHDFELAYQQLEDFADWHPEGFRLNAALAAIFKHRKVSYESGYLFQRATATTEGEGSRLEVLLKMAVFYQRTGYPRSTMRCLEAAVRRAPKRVDLRLRLAYMAQKYGEADKALKQCAEVIRLHSRRPEAYQLSGALLRELGRKEDAEKMFASARRLREHSKAG